MNARGRRRRRRAVGQVSVLPRDGQTSAFDAAAPSDETRRLVDNEVRRMVDASYLRGRIIGASP